MVFEGAAGVEYYIIIYPGDVSLAESDSADVLNGIGHTGNEANSRTLRT